MIQPVAATQVSSPYSQHPASFCIDGNLKTVCYTNGHPFPWLAIELPGGLSVTSIKLTLGHGAYIKNLEARVCDSVASLNDHQRFAAGVLLATFAGPGTNGETIQLASADRGGVPGTFLVLQTNPNPQGSSAFSLREVQMFGHTIGELILRCNIIF